MGEFLKTNINDLLSRSNDSNVSNAATKAKASHSNIEQNKSPIVQPKFKTTNINNLKNQQATAAQNDATEFDNTENFNTNSYKGEKYPKTLNWQQELSDRLEANRRVTPDLQKPISEVEKKFWIDCFVSLWPEELCPYLDSLGEYFKEDLLKWGFSKNINPMVAFLDQGYVQNKLLKTKKLNKNSYKALHNVILNKCFALKEFAKSNDYNILYSPALYEKSPADIYKYFLMQKYILDPNTSQYSQKTQHLNKRIFIQMLKNSSLEVSKAVGQISKIAEDKVSKVSVKTSAKLNNLDLITEYLKQLGTESREAAKPATASDDEIYDIVSDIKKAEDAAALITFIAGKTTTQKDALKVANFANKVFKDIPANVGALSDIIVKLGNKTISSQSISMIIKELSNRF